MKYLCFLLFSLLVLSLFSCGTTKKTARAEPSLEELEHVDAVAEVMPSFQKGNEEKFNQWVSRGVLRSMIQRYSGAPFIQGAATAVYVVEKDGTIQDVAIVSASDPEVGRMVRNQILRSPKWSPGYTNGEAVRVRFLTQIELSVVGVTSQRVTRTTTTTIRTTGGRPPGTYY